MMQLSFIFRRYILQGMLATLAAVMPTLAIAQTPGPTIEQRLQRVEDELAIRRVLVDYASTQDARDYAGYAALFAKNGDGTVAPPARPARAQGRADAGARRPL
jgi:hypothetical protein